jgi:hypothetical protein
MPMTMSQSTTETAEANRRLIEGAYAAFAKSLSPLHQRLQPRQRFVPLGRDRVEKTPRRLDPLRLELPDSLAPPAHAADDAGLSENAQVLGHSLTRHAGAGRQARDREAPLPGEP